MRDIDSIRKIAFWKKDDPRLSQYLERLAFVQQTIEELLLRIFEEQIGIDPTGDLIPRGGIEEKDFYGMDRPEVGSAEIEEMRRRVLKLGRKLAVKYSRRYRAAKRGRIDLQRTMRSAFRTGGIPLSLKYRRRIRKKPNLILLCDVSKSVVPFSEFMLRLVYAIQERFRGVRSFFFVDMVDEVTDMFRDRSLDEALQEAFSNARFARSGISDFGRVFAMFVNRYLPEVPSRATVIVLGDARNNGYPDDRKFLWMIAEKVERIIWLNPQPAEEWNKDDSIIGIYAEYCDQVLECRNLRQLEKAVELISSGSEAALTLESRQ